jgi:hypothetical protein
MKWNFRFSVVLLAGLASAPLIAQEETEPSFGDFTYAVNWRVRYEGVDQFGFADEANALTSRIRAGITSGPFADTKLMAELVIVSDWVNDYNSTTNGNTGYPVVADPAGFAEINRFALINDSIDKTTLTLGRQRLILDDARFVGNVGWRQNEQTYDGLSAKIAADAFTADLAYFHQVNRIFGPDSPNGTWDGDIVLLNASKTLQVGKLTAFAYRLEFDEAAGASNETLGIRLTGSKAVGDSALIYTLSFAGQSEAGDNPSDYSETYSKLEGGVTHGKLTLALGLETLGGDGANAFMTPLATLHAFQGWGDKFLSTPVGGIADSYLRFAWSPAISGPFDSVSLAGVYHWFDADTGGASYGDEIDLSVAARIDRITLTFKYAAYSADALFTDTDKLWLSMDYAF